MSFLLYKTKSQYFYLLRYDSTHSFHRSTNSMELSPYTEVDACSIVLLLCSREFATGSCPELGESSLHPYTIQVILSLQFFCLKLYVFLYFLLHAACPASTFWLACQVWSMLTCGPRINSSPDWWGPSDCPVVRSTTLACVAGKSCPHEPILLCGACFGLKTVTGADSVMPYPAKQIYNCCYSHVVVGCRTLIVYNLLIVKPSINRKKVIISEISGSRTDGLNSVCPLRSSLADTN